MKRETQKRSYCRTFRICSSSISLISSARRCGWRRALDASEKLLHIGQGFTDGFRHAPRPACIRWTYLLSALAGAVLVRLAVYVKGEKREEIPQGH